jgi:hypothetical protein
LVFTIKILFTRSGADNKIRGATVAMNCSTY